MIWTMSVVEATAAQTQRTEKLTSGQASEVINGLDRFRNSKAFCDAELEVGAQTFPVHKCVLASVSGFFFKLFTTEMREKYEDKIPITGVSATTLGDVLDFVYTSQITIREDNVYDILAASNYLMIESLKELCTDFLLGDDGKFLTVENSMKILLASRQHQAIRLEEKSGEFIADHYDILRKEKWFIESNLQMVKVVLTLKNKSAEAYRLIVDWVEHDIEKRRDFFPDLFTSLDLNRISPEYQSTVIANNKLIFDFRCCTELVVKSLAGSSVLSISRCIVAFDEGLSRIRLHDVQNGRELLLPKAFENGIPAKLNDYIYLFGKQSEVSTAVKKLNLTEPTKGWQRETSMQTEMVCQNTTVFDGKIWVAGTGTYISHTSNRKRYTSTNYIIQVFNVASKTWTKILEQPNFGFPMPLLIQQTEKESNTLHIFKWSYQTVLYDGSENTLKAISFKQSPICDLVCLDNLYYYFCKVARKSHSVQLLSYDPKTEETTKILLMKDVTSVKGLCSHNGKIIAVPQRPNGIYILAIVDVCNKQWRILREIDNIDDFYGIL